MFYIEKACPDCYSEYDLQKKEVFFMKADFTRGPVFGLYLNWAYFGFWLVDALANFTPLWVGAAFYASGKWKERRL